MAAGAVFSHWLRPLVFVLALLPLAWFGLRLLVVGPGANPIEAAIRFSGDWALIMLLVALAVTPLRRLSGWAGVMRLRRMLGLYAFFYAAVHVLLYVGVDQFFDWAAIWADVVKRRYITVGMAAFLILLVLALTSPGAVVRRLGGRAWKRLHAGVYLAGPLVILHFLMMVKADWRQPMGYAAVLFLLLVLRLPGIRNWRWSPWAGLPFPFRGDDGIVSVKTQDQPRA